MAPRSKKLVSNAPENSKPTLPYPSQVRKIILEDHARLRVLLDEFEARWKRISPSQEDFRVLSARLEEHWALEDRILRPTLKDIDPWGDVRVERFNSEHSTQRDLLTGLAQAFERHESDSPERLRSFLVELRDDMTREENEFLAEKLLRDDLVSVDSSDG